jgi:hypothetical protein
VSSSYAYGAVGGVALAVVIAVVRKARGLSALPPDPPPPPPPPGSTWWQAHPGFKVYLTGWVLAASGVAVALLVWKPAGAVLVCAGMLAVIAYKYPSDWRRPAWPPWPPWPFWEFTAGDTRARSGTPESPLTGNDSPS